MSSTPITSSAHTPSRPPAAQTGLRANSLGLGGVLMQGIATIGPAFGLIVTFQFAVTEAGLAAPLVYLLAAFVILLMAINVGQLSKYLPSAGGFYTYLSRTLDPRIGFMSGWIFSVWLPPAAMMTLGYLGSAILEPELKARYGFTLPWWILPIVLSAFVAWTVYQGVTISQKLLLIFGLTEITIVVALAVTGIFSPGHGGFNLKPFGPGNATSAQGLYLGVVFSVFGYTGWEGITPLAEESKDPKRNVQRALFGSVALLGLLFVFCSWGFMVGIGTDKVAGIASATRNPTFALAEHLWSGAWILVLIALLNSAIAIAIAVFNASTRLWYAMGRSGSLPAALGVVHPTRQTPTNAIHVQVGVTAIVFVLMALFGPTAVFTVWALAITLGLIIVYVTINVGVFRWFRTEARSAFNPLLHLVLPIVASAAVLWIGYKSVVPLPAAPGKYGPIVIAVWIALGIGVLVALRLRGDQRWLTEAGQAMAEADEPANLGPTDLAPANP